MSLPDLSDAQAQSVEVRRAVQTLANHGLLAYVSDLAAKLGITARGACSEWRNIHYGESGDRRWGIWEATDLESRKVGNVPFGDRLTVAKTVPVGSNLWLELGPGPHQGHFVLAQSAGTIHCVDLAKWRAFQGAIPSTAFAGQDYPEEGMFTEGYSGEQEVCVLSASGDAFWRELNIEMLFRDIGTATVFEAQWGGSETFTDWVGYYAVNVAIYSGGLFARQKRLIVTVKPTALWRKYLAGRCRGPSVAEVIDAVGKAQAKECEWMHNNRERLRVLWETMEFVTAFTFLRLYAHWTDFDCRRAATQKLVSVWKRWDSLSAGKRGHQLETALFCLDEAFDGLDVGRQTSEDLGRKISEVLLDLLVSIDGCPIGDKDAVVLAWTWALQAPKAHLRAILGKLIERDSLNPLFEADAEFAKHALTELGGQYIPGSFVYVVGGHEGNNSLSSAEVYDPALAAWAPLPPMAAPRRALAAAALGGLCALGGQGAGGSGAEEGAPDEGDSGGGEEGKAAAGSAASALELRAGGATAADGGRAPAQREAAEGAGAEGEGGSGAEEGDGPPSDWGTICTQTGFKLMERCEEQGALEGEGGGGSASWLRGGLDRRSPRRSVLTVVETILSRRQGRGEAA